MRIKAANEGQGPAHAQKGPLRWDTLSAAALPSALAGTRREGERRVGGSLGKVFILGHWIESSVQALGLGDEPTPLPPLQPAAVQGPAGCVALALLTPTQARARCPTGHSLVGHSPSPAALSAMEGLITYAIWKGHLSPLYVQPLLVKAENCLAPVPVSPRKGMPFSLTGRPSRLTPRSLPNAPGSDPFGQALTGFLPTIGRQLAGQPCEAVGLAHLERDPPGHLFIPQDPRIAEPWPYAQSFLQPFSN